VFGLDMTAGCPHGCAYCHIRSLKSFPGEDRVLFDPFVSEKLAAFLDELELLPLQVVLSPSSDPLPPQREVRSETRKVIDALFNRHVPVMLMTRGRIGRPIRELLSAHADKVKVAIGTTTLNKSLSRAIEPWAASPRSRLRDLRYLLRLGVSTEVRLE